jgi:tRNA modification GTPase
LLNDTIVALSTPAGVGAIAVIRISGHDAIINAVKIFKGKNLTLQKTHTVHFGYIMDGENVVDEVVATIFIAPQSFTKENIVEISCHGSVYIYEKIIKLLLKVGCRYAKAGEFTQRAFLNGRFDLAQAEAVADLIAADNESSHDAAMKQMRGGFSKQIKELRTSLLNFASLIELELDFAEEDVEFAERNDLRLLINQIVKVLTPLIESFDWGNVIKTGIPIVIAGKPNAGKSTLLNALLNEEKAMVSDIAGTTRDVIEDELQINGIKFRFIDTAGLRETNDKLEAMGIERTRKKMLEASLLLYLFDVNTTTNEILQTEIASLKGYNIPILLIGNKIDKNETKLSENFETKEEVIYISAGQKLGIDNLKHRLLAEVRKTEFKTGNTIVTNVRHYESLTLTLNALESVLQGIDLHITTDLLAEDIKQATYYLGTITGEITNDELLGNIFSKFCIGK